MVDFFSAGITPAYAGKSGRKADHHPRWRDHPRICGEKSCAASCTFLVVGSPPHMRGKVIMQSTTGQPRGITPAYAGKSPIKLATERTKTGSPPHMRGKGRTVGWTSWKSGITPAYAGKRLKRSRSTVPPVAIVPLFPSVCNKPVVSDGSPAGRDAPLFLPAENAVPASPAYNLRSL